MGGGNPVQNLANTVADTVKGVSDIGKAATGGLLDIEGLTKNSANFMTGGLLGKQIYSLGQTPEDPGAAAHAANLQAIIKDPSADKKTRDLARLGQLSVEEAARYVATGTARQGQVELAKLLLQNPGAQQTMLTGSYASGQQEASKKSLLGGK